MAHIMGMTFVSNGRVFWMDEANRNFGQSAPINAVTAAIPVGPLTDPKFRVYVGTSDGNIALFPGDNPPQVIHVTDASILWSLYHAADTVYLGTGDFQSDGPFPFLALDDQTFAVRWSTMSSGPVTYPAGVSYTGNVPQQVIFGCGEPNHAVRAFDVATGTELWNVPEYAFGVKVHQGVVYYANIVDSTLRARSAATGTLLWSYRNSHNFNFQRPATAGGVVWASTVGNEVYAFRASDGAVLWVVQTGIHGLTRPLMYFDHTQGLSLLAVAEQNGVNPGFVKALDANTGALLWTSSDPVSSQGGSCSDPIVISRGLVQVGTWDGRLMTFRGRDGRLVWARSLTPGSPLVATPHWAPW
jgi:outer membrane protein assembly factor BamB